jgi:UDP-glucose-4-epimerase GalE
MNTTPLRILVTGGAGFIGSRVCDLLLRAGHGVTVFDNFSTGYRHLVPQGGVVVEGDVRDADAISQAVEGHDAVMHFAAQALVAESVTTPQKSFDINLAGGFNLLEAMRTHGVNQLVHSSSCAIYGAPERMPVREDDRMLPLSPYGASKLAFEALLHSYHAAYDINVTMFRYFNPYGPHEIHDPETHAIPNFINAALNNSAAPVYWNGECVRDFFFVDDIARAHIMGLGHEGFDAFNLGSGAGTSIREVVERIYAIVGTPLQIEDLGERPGDPMALYADITKATTELGWKPEVSLEDGLRLTIDAFTSRRP